MNWREAPWPVVAAAGACSGAATYFSTAAHDSASLAWAAPVPVLALAFALAARPRSGEKTRPAGIRLAVGAFLASFAGNLAWFSLYRGVLPAAALLSMALLLAVLFAGAIAFTGHVARRVGPWAGILAFPCAWVSGELAMARLSPHGTFGSIAYSQVDVLPLVQLAAFAGLPAITFVVLLAAGGLGALIAYGRKTRWQWRYAVVPGLVALAALGLGQWRLAAASDSPRRVLVGLASSDTGMSHHDTTERAVALPILERYLDAARRLARRGAEAVVLPEKMVGVAPAYEDEARRQLASVSDEQDALVVVGLDITGERPKRNLAEVYSHGHRVVQYEKRRPVPGLEAGYARGSEPGLYLAPGGMTGVAICKDLDFPGLAAEYGRAGAGILFVPAWDFVRDARLHSRMAVMRGVEGGYSVARAAADGLLTGSDHLGRVVAERSSSESVVSTLLVALPLGPGRTFYSEHGDWFGWLAVAAVACLAVLSAVPARLRRAAASSR